MPTDSTADIVERFGTPPEHNEHLRLDKIGRKPGICGFGGIYLATVLSEKVSFGWLSIK